MASGRFDYEFTPELPDDLVCVVCHLALKRPKQIEECGHRFYESCFDDMKNHVTEGDDMQCPVDRQIFSQEKVFRDKASERNILSWQVKCRNKEQGCDWIGELNTVQNHLEQCSFRDKVNDVNENEILDLKRQLFRIEKAILTGFSKVHGEIREIYCQIDKLREEFSSDTNDLKGSHKSLKDMITESREEFSLKRKKPSVTGPGDLGTLTVISESKWEWKCPVFSTRGTNQYSPPFYYQKRCFHIWMSYNENDYEENNLNLFLSRFRGVFDHPQDYTENNFPKECTFLLSIRNSDGNFNKVELTKNPWSIEIGEKASLGEGKSLKYGFNFINNGFYHILCEKIVSKVGNEPKRKHAKK